MVTLEDPNARRNAILEGNRPRSQPNDAPGHLQSAARSITIDSIDANAGLGNSQIILVVGDTGSGKTTLIQLFVAQYGTKILADYYFNYNDTKSISRTAWLNHIAAHLLSSMPTKGLKKIPGAAETQRQLELFLRESGGALAPTNSIDTLVAALSICCNTRLVGSHNSAHALQWLVIDAVDEAKVQVNETDENPIEGGPALDAIRALVSKRSDWHPDLRLLVTGRTAASLKEWFELDDNRVAVIDLSIPNDKDLSSNYRLHSECSRYVDGLFKQSPLSTRENSETLAWIKNRLLYSAQGNFLLMELNLREIENFIQAEDGHRALLAAVGGSNESEPRRHKLEIPRNLNDLFAKDLGRRYDRIIDRVCGKLGFSSFDRLRSIFDVILASADPGGLTIDIISKATDSKAAEIKTLLDLLDHMLIEVSGGYSLHKSVSDWLNGELPGKTRASALEGHRLLAQYCAREPDQLLLDSYIRRHAITHFIAVEDLKKAAEYSANLLQHKDNRRPSAQDLGREVLLALSGSDNELAKSQIIPEHLITLLEHIYQTEPLRGALDILEKYHSRDFFEGNNSYRRKLLALESYVVCFEVGNSQGEACTKPNGLYQRHDLLAELKDSDATIREAACYGVARLCTLEGHEDEIDALLKHNDGTFIPQQAFGEALLNLILQRRISSERARKLLRRTKKPIIWQHNEINFIDAEAAYAVLYNVPAELCASREAYEHLKALDDDLIRADEAPKSESTPREQSFELLLAELDVALERNNFYALGSDNGLLDTVHTTAKKIRVKGCEWPIESLKEKFRLLFSHPVWNVGESAASIFALLFKRGDTVIQDKLAAVLAEFLRPDITRSGKWQYHWKVRLAAIEAAFILADTNESIFLTAVRDFYRDENCRIRGLCAEDLHDFICRGNPDRWPTRIKAGHAREYFEYWLSDSDCWVLDHIFHHLQELGSRLPEVKYDPPEEMSVLGGLKLSQIQGWKRSRFLIEIEKRRSKQLKVLSSSPRNKL